MESLIVISIKLKYDHQTQSFKLYCDEGQNGRGAAAALSKGEGKYFSQGNKDQVRERTNIGVMWDAPLSALPDHIKTKGENYN